MRKISATKRQGICAVVLLSLTLLLGFTAAPALRYNQERQAAPTELVSKNSSQQAVAHPIFKNDFQLHFFISSREIVTRLGLFDLKVKIDLAENLKSLMLAKRLKIKLLYLTSGRLQLADTYFIRG